jgi:hypothetical protein
MVDLTHAAAFLSGVGAVLSSLLALRRMKRNAERECERRIEEIRRAIHEGYEMRER